MNERYSIETHGDGFALYFGRSETFHGWNLCKMTEFDSNGEKTREDIVKALNANLAAKGVHDLPRLPCSCHANTHGKPLKGTRCGLCGRELA